MTLKRIVEFWQKYSTFILGLLGWAIIVTHYPIGWQLPIYAGY